MQNVECRMKNGSSPQSMGYASAMNVSKCCRKVCYADGRAIVVRYPNEHADSPARSRSGVGRQKIHHRGTEDTEFTGHRDSQTTAPEVRCVSLLAVDIWSSLNGTMQTLVFLPNTDHSIKSEIGAPSILDLMEPPLRFCSSVPPCLRGKIPPFDPQILVRSQTSYASR